MAKSYKLRDISQTSITAIACKPEEVKGEMELGKGTNMYLKVNYYPNFFWRFMQWLVFGFVWRKKNGKTNA